jgi:hypothetical protein
MAINKSPDASGSRVPAKPILLNLYRNFNSLITPKDSIPSGLLISNHPLGVKICFNIFYYS